MSQHNQEPHPSDKEQKDSNRSSKTDKMLQEGLEHHTGRSSDLTVADQVGICIHLLGCNVMQSDAARIAGCNQATVSRALEAFLAAMNDVAERFIRWPDSDECAAIRRSFFHSHGLPGIVGIIDGTHCKIMRPSNDAEDYICRKIIPALTYAPEKAAEIVVACCVLRNIAINAKNRGTTMNTADKTDKMKKFRLNR
ncbi:hypothetical protein ANCCEY_06792 [Ancylostoma ceylanicum]|uniref:Nuclease HARBI1 n=1 Tax=Ancylostoma ceylanicum TaxID=53326 RepID=A0A0D6LVK6_9BILA|nr:hypothetical protein ANCCEY_06792 [Ancylostoma ceylanicum]